VRQVVAVQQIGVLGPIVTGLTAGHTPSASPPAYNIVRGQAVFGGIDGRGPFVSAFKAALGYSAKAFAIGKGNKLSSEMYDLRHLFRIVGG
jgi:hypothetical protein